jgi:hypothetical protein
MYTAIVEFAEVFARKSPAAALLSWAKRFITHSCVFFFAPSSDKLMGRRHDCACGVEEELEYQAT